MSKNITKVTVFLFIILTILSTGCWANKSGKIKKKIEYRYDFIEKSGEYSLKIRERWIYEYDTKGNTIRALKYSSNSYSVKIFYYEYNKRGDITNEYNYPFSHEDICYRYDYEYNGEGKMVEWRIYKKDGCSLMSSCKLLRKYSYHYDKKGNIIEKVIYDSEGNLLNKFSWEYNQEGNKIKGAVYDSHHCLLSETIYEYSDERIYEKLYHPSPVLLWKVIYDERKNEIERVIYDLEGEVWRRFVYIYNKKGDMVEEKEYDSQGRLSRRTFCKFNTQGKIYEKVCYIYKVISGKLREIPVEKIIYEYEYY